MDGTWYLVMTYRAGSESVASKRKLKSTTEDEAFKEACALWCEFKNTIYSNPRLVYETNKTVE